MTPGGGVKPSTDAIEKWPGTAEKPVSSGVGDIGTVMGQVSRSNANRRARPGSRRGRRRTGQFHQARLALRLHSQREESCSPLGTEERPSLPYNPPSNSGRRLQDRGGEPPITNPPIALRYRFGMTRPATRIFPTASQKSRHPIT